MMGARGWIRVLVVALVAALTPLILVAAFGPTSSWVIVLLVYALWAAAALTVLISFAALLRIWVRRRPAHLERE